MADPIAQAFIETDPVLVAYSFFLMVSSAIAAYLVMKLPVTRGYAVPEISSRRSLPPEMRGLYPYMLFVLENETEYVRNLVSELNENRQRSGNAAKLPENVLVIENNEDYKRLIRMSGSGGSVTALVPCGGGSVVGAFNITAEPSALSRAVRGATELGNDRGIVLVDNVQEDIYFFCNVDKKATISINDDSAIPVLALHQLTCSRE